MKKIEEISIKSAGTYFAGNIYKTGTDAVLRPLVDTCFTIVDDYSMAEKIAINAVSDLIEYNHKAEKSVLAKLVRVKRQIKEDCTDADDILRAIRKGLADKKNEVPIYKAIIVRLLEYLREVIKPVPAKFSKTGQFAEIAKFFELDEVGARIIAFLFVASKVESFNWFLNQEGEFTPKSAVIKNLANAIGFTEKQTREAFETVSEQCLDQSSDDFIRRRRCNSIQFELSSQISDFILNFDGKSIAEKYSRQLKTQKTFPLGSFDVASHDIEIISSLLNASCANHILIYGTPGTGKSEFAKSIARKLGKKVFIPDRAKGKGELTAGDIAAAIFTARKSDGIALIDECDDFLETAPGFFSESNKEKGTVNEFIDRRSCKNEHVIWISNSIRGIDRSTRRRFAYSLEISKISEESKRAIVRNTLDEKGLPDVDTDAVYAIVKRFLLNPAGIALALDKAKAVCREHSRFIETVERFAEAHTKLIHGTQSAAKRFENDEHFDSRVLNLDTPYEQVKNTVGTYAAACEKERKVFPLSFLFTGIPGTGKTELGRNIATLLDRELIVKRASDIVNPYVGQTEINIAAAFREAEEKGAVLMIDEADSFFNNRGNAQRGWEVSQVNEILAQMETFAGVFICTTNLLENIDPAAMRRFHWKIKFFPPNVSGREILFSKYFAHGNEVAPEIRDALAELDGLCPGDFKSVFLRERFNSARTDATVIAALRNELAYKENTATRRLSGFAG